MGEHIRLAILPKINDKIAKNQITEINLKNKYTKSIIKIKVNEVKKGLKVNDIRFLTRILL